MIACKISDKEMIAGFTLLEAMIATALMGLIMAALATLTAQWLPNWNRGLVDMQRRDQIALGLDRLSTDIAAAQIVPINGEARKPFFQGSDRSLTFVRTVIGPNRSTGLEFVRIAEMASERGPVLVRSRAPFLPSDRIRPNFTDPVVLLRAPYRISFSYAGSDRVWQNEWRDRFQLPKSVKLTVRDATTQQTLAVSSATSIHAELPVTCISVTSYDECIRTLQSSETKKPAAQL
jgi:general secretion pathway protein J